MSGYESRAKRGNRARERQMARQRRSTPGSPASDWRKKALRFRLAGRSAGWQGRLGLLIRDFFWYVTHTPQILMGLAALGAILFLLFIATHALAGRIFPNVWAVGVPLGDLTIEQAVIALQDTWDKNTRIQLMDGDRHWTATPADLGLHLDAEKTVEAARGVGMAGIPMGYSVNPVVSLDFTTGQNYLLNLTTLTDLPPVNATYQLQSDQLVGVAGIEGRMLDIPSVMEQLMKDPVQVAVTRRVDLLMTVLKPVVTDPEPLLEDAQAVASQPFTINGYDPFTDQSISWSTTRDVLVSWLEAGEQGLTLRDDTFATFLKAQNQSLNPSPDSPPRFLDEREVKDRISKAMQEHSPSVELRIHYLPTKYEIQSGDTGNRIARRTGIPFYLIDEANPNVNWNALGVDQILQLPTRDITLPQDPVPNKRIVVDLDTQSLTAFENGQVKFNWLISSGISTAPTSPGIFQILTHNDVASGSSYTLCDSNLNCGQWEMYNFMGIYEVVPGLMNGFHGAVLLPNGTYLGGGSVGSPYTFGCVMSQADNGKLLYEWADIGTVVEIISREFAPQSALAQTVWQQDHGTA